MKIHKTRTRFLQKIIYVFCSCLFRIFLPIEVRGRENLNKYNGNFIVALNHQTELDVFIVLVVLNKIFKKKPIYFVSRESSFYDLSAWRGRFYGGWLFRQLGAYPVYANTGDYRIAVKNHIYILEKSYPVCIFPEGIRSKNGVMGKSKGGVAFLSQASKTVIMPIALSGLNNLSSSSFWKRRHKVIFSIGGPIDMQSILKKEDSHDFNYYNTNAQVVTESINAML